VSAPRFDRDAERSVVGAVVSAASYSVEGGWRILDRARGAGVRSDSFYSFSLGAIWAQLESLREADVALDPITVGAEIERHAEERVGPIGELLDFDVSTIRARLHELAHEVTSFGSIEHWAQIVVREAERRTREAA
jgi:replicative DNA helicase